MNEEIRQHTKWFMEDRFGMFIQYRKYFDQFDPVFTYPLPDEKDTVLKIRLRQE